MGTTERVSTVNDQGVPDYGCFLDKVLISRFSRSDLFTLLPDPGDDRKDLETTALVASQVLLLGSGSLDHILSHRLEGTDLDLTRRPTAGVRFTGHLLRFVAHRICVHERGRALGAVRDDESVVLLSVSSRLFQCRQDILSCGDDVVSVPPSNPAHGRTKVPTRLNPSDFSVRNPHEFADL